VARRRIIGLHGTSEPALILGCRSHGCIGLRSGDTRRLSALTPVGAPPLFK